MTCRQCHHDRDAHQHYRRGSDCAACDCPKFQTSAVDAVMALLQRRPVEQPDPSAAAETHASAA